MLGMRIKKCSRIQGSAFHKIGIVLPISLHFEQNLPISRALSATGYPGVVTFHTHVTLSAFQETKDHETYLETNDGWND